MKYAQTLPVTQSINLRQTDRKISARNGVKNTRRKTQYFHWLKNHGPLTTAIDYAPLSLLDQQRYRRAAEMIAGNICAKSPLQHAGAVNALLDMQHDFEKEYELATHHGACTEYLWKSRSSWANKSVAPFGFDSAEEVIDHLIWRTDLKTPHRLGLADLSQYAMAVVDELYCTAPYEPTF